MADIDAARINGNAFSWSSVTWKIGDSRIYGFKAINYKDARERSPVVGSARHHAPRGMTAGKYTVDPVTCTVEKETAQAIRDALAAKAGTSKSFGNVEFEIVVQYQETRDGAPKVITDELHRCTYRETASKAEESPDAIYEELAFNCLSITWGGKVLFDASEGSP